MSRLDPRTLEAHRASTTRTNPTVTAIANFGSLGKSNDGIERMVYQS